jgi:GGDEF domain-containing protein
MGADYGAGMGAEPAEPEEELPPGFVEDAAPGAEPATAAAPETEELPPGFVEDAAPEPVDPEQVEKDKDEQIRSLFAPTLGAGVDPEKHAGILELARQTGVKADVVESNYDSMKAAWEKARFNPREWRQKNPELEKLALERPDLGPLIVRDKKLNFLQRLEKGLLEFGEWADPFLKSMTLEGEQPGGLTEEGKADLERLRTPQKETVRQDVAASNLTGMDRAAVPFIQFMRSRQGSEQSLLGAQLLKAKMQGQDTWEIEKKLADMQSDRLAGTYDYGSGPIEQAFVDAADLAASQVETMGSFGKVGGTAAAVAGTAVGLVTRSPAAATDAALWAGSFFGKVGAAAKSFQLESGSAYLELRGQKTDDGRLIDDNVAVGASVAYGIIATAIEQGLLGLELKNLGPLGDVLRTGERKAFMSMMLKDAGFASIAKNVGRAWLANAAGEATEEGLQDAAQQIFSYLGKSVSQGLNEGGVYTPQAGPAWDPETTADVVQKTFSGMLVSGAPGAMLNATTQAIMLDAAKKGGEHVQAIIGAAKDSPTVKAAPEAVAKLIEKTTSHVYVDAQAFTKLFQENEADPAEAARELMGPKGPQLLADAVASGENLEVPIADYLEKWAAKPIAEALAEDTQTKPGMLTPRQAAEFSQAIEQHAEALAKENAKEDAAPSEFERRFVDSMELKLQDQGVVGKEKVRAALTPMRAFLRTMAERSGKTVDELFGHVRLGTGEQGPTGDGTPGAPAAPTTPMAPPVPAAPVAAQASGVVPGTTQNQLEPAQVDQPAEVSQDLAPVAEDADTSFDFGANVDAVAAIGPGQLEEVRGVISRMRPDNQKMASDWLAYATGETKERPAITPAMEKKLARYGLVDPVHGFTYGEDGRSLERKVTSRKVRGEMPEEFRRQRLEKLEHALGTTLNYYYQGEAEAVAALVEQFKGLPEAEQLRRFYLDENTGLLNERAFTRLQPEGKGLVGHISIEGTKFQNDTAGHEAGDRLYRAAGQALQAISPEAAKVGGDFVVWVADQGELDGIVGELTKKPELGGYQATGVVGPDVKEAGKLHADVKQAAEKAGTRAERGQRPLGAVAGAVFPSAAPKLSGIPTRLVEAFKAMKPEDAAREVYVEKATGLLTGEGFFALPRKKHQASIDLNGLKVINQLFGDQAGDDLLEIFGTLRAGGWRTCL